MPIHAEHTLNVVPRSRCPRKRKTAPLADANERHGCSARHRLRLGCSARLLKRKEDGSLFRRERWIIRRRNPAARFHLDWALSARREEDHPADAMATNHQRIPG